ncbi:unnamed protein product [Pleuronectes platessa]|uniref:Uncharacterized protein n=1 Tax=Pleuronectes platessa TaxID=8262 RepID=A0A9N7YA24_PLEPL|nr:unnamed protein product [Pleuronectes platessa]
MTMLQQASDFHRRGRGEEEKRGRREEEQFEEQRKRRRRAEEEGWKRKIGGQQRKRRVEAEERKMKMEEEQSYRGGRGRWEEEQRKRGGRGRWDKEQRTMGGRGEEKGRKRGRRGRWEEEQRKCKRPRRKQTLKEEKLEWGLTTESTELHRSEVRGLRKCDPQTIDPVSHMITVITEEPTVCVFAASFDSCGVSPLDLITTPGAMTDLQKTGKVPVLIQKWIKGLYFFLVRVAQGSTVQQLVPTQSST